MANATGMQIGGIDIQSPMDADGGYAFDPGEVLESNGRGASVTVPYATLTWRFESLTPAQMAWWCTTLLGGAASAEFSQCKLFNHIGALTTFAHCIVRRPTYEQFEDGLLKGVTVVIDWIY